MVRAADSDFVATPGTSAADYTQLESFPARASPLPSEPGLPRPLAPLFLGQQISMLREERREGPAATSHISKKNFLVLFVKSLLF